MESLIDYMEELDSSLSIITESWLKPGTRLNEDIVDLEKCSNIGLLHCSRRSRRGRNAGGGVAILFDRDKCNLKERKIKRGSAEILCATGRVNNFSRKIAILGVYISPRVRAKQYHLTLELISDAIRKLKEEFADPLIIVAGDFNHTNIEEATNEFPDLTTIQTGATRGSATLDMISTNAKVKESLTMAPLSTNDGKESDHAVIHVCTELDQLHHFKKKILKVRPRTKAGEEKFKNLILTESWDDFLADSTEGPSVLAAKLEEITRRWMDICFPEKNLTIKSTDLPWINHEIKKKITNRKKEFKRSRNKRSELWHIMKAETDDMIKKAKKEYYDNMKCLAKSRDNPSLYYKAVARLKDAEKASQFDILDLFPGKTEEQAGSEIADFFNKITDNYTPLDRISHSPADPIVVQNYEVAAALKKFKKPKGLVACDIFPDLSTLYADILAIPLTRIFNEGFKRGEWPEIWRQETAVIIPKCRQPESMSDLRNLSCTPVYSKLMESFVLERIKKETKIRPSQYGCLLYTSPSPRDRQKSRMPSSA